MNTKSTVDDVMQEVLDTRLEAQSGQYDNLQVVQRELFQWVEVRTAYQDRIMYIPALAMTVMLAPHASEVYNFGWQELQDELQAL